MAAKYVLKPCGAGQFMFNLKAGNGEVILTSEMYKVKQSALDAIESVKDNALDDSHFERKTAKKRRSILRSQGD